MKLPSLDALIAEAMRTVIRRAIWQMPKKYMAVAVIVVVLLSIFFGK
jgi:hypothetical protein